MGFGLSDYGGVARLRDGVSLETARAEMQWADCRHRPTPIRTIRARRQRRHEDDLHRPDAQGSDARQRRARALDPARRGRASCCWWPARTSPTCSSCAPRPAARGRDSSRARRGALRARALFPDRELPALDRRRRARAVVAGARCGCWSASGRPHCRDSTKSARRRHDWLRRVSVACWPRSSSARSRCGAGRRLAARSTKAAAPIRHAARHLARHCPRRVKWRWH